MHRLDQPARCEGQPPPHLHRWLRDGTAAASVVTEGRSANLCGMHDAHRDAALRLTDLDGLRPARGLAAGVVLGGAIWVVIGVALWLLW
jgi:hypothetical protein